MRDGADHLATCIDSLVRQTDDDFEVVAVDDGSRDATPRLLEDWTTADPRVRVFTQDRLGLVTALERARYAARGRWLARMDADDIALPARLARQRELAERDPTLVLCGCGIRYIPRSGLGRGALRYERWLNALVEPADLVRDLFVECPLAHPTFFMRAEAVANVGGYRDHGWPEDYDLLLRLWRAGGRLGTVPEALLEWRDRPNRLSRTHRSYDADAFRRCKAHHLTRSLLKGRDGVVVWGAGPVGKAFSRRLTDEGMRVRAFVDLNPRKLGQEIHGAPVIPPLQVTAYRGAFCVVAVGQFGARARIRAWLIRLGWKEGKDFMAVA